MSRDLMLALTISIVAHAAVLHALPLEPPEHSGTGRSLELVVLGVVESAAAPEAAEDDVPEAEEPSEPAPEVKESAAQPDTETNTSAPPPLPRLEIPRPDFERPAVEARRRVKAASETLADAWNSLQKRTMAATLAEPGPEPEPSEPAAQEADMRDEPAPREQQPSAPAAPAASAPRTAPAPSKGSRADPGAREPTHGERDQARTRYLEEVLARVQRTRFYPVPARRRRQEGTVRVRFTILSNGEVRGIETIGPSGHAALDDAATETVRRAAPFDPFPEAIEEDALTAVVPVVYRLR